MIDYIVDGLLGLFVIKWPATVLKKLLLLTQSLRWCREMWSYYTNSATL